MCLRTQVALSGDGEEGKVVKKWIRFLKNHLLLHASHLHDNGSMEISKCSDGAKLYGERGTIAEVDLDGEGVDRVSGG